MERAELASLLGGRRSEVSGKRDAGRVCISESAPQSFLSALANAVAGEEEIFLCNPAWSTAERKQVDELLAQTAPQRGARGWLMIPTGGSSGSIKFARHDGFTVAAAVAGFARHFGLSPVNAVGVLPLFHVSGLMAALRCALTGGTYLPADWKNIEAGQRHELPAGKDGWVISLVPTQLERLLRDAAAVDWLRRFKIVFLGGAPAWPELLERAANARLPLSLGYGMTETAAMVAALRPAEFLAGDRSCGTAMPHASLALDAEGRITVSGESIFHGYYPAPSDSRSFTTEDLGSLDTAGRLRVLGRRDGVIITGGEKVQPLDVEAALRDTGEFADVIVLGLPHPEWGQQVVAAYPAASRPDLAKVEQALSRRLTAFKRPKRYLALADWPRTAHGKINRTELLARITELVQAGGR
ncbi:MAG: AMP-binding protein [Opitutae bacterium]|nr:AMP-binding protein [Opitutae bacterium]